MIEESTQVMAEDLLLVRTENSPQVMTENSPQVMAVDSPQVILDLLLVMTGHTTSNDSGLTASHDRGHSR
jgi:hypothetical protein